MRISSAPTSMSSPATWHFSSSERPVHSSFRPAKWVGKLVFYARSRPDLLPSVFAALRCDRAEAEGGGRQEKEKPPVVCGFADGRSANPVAQILKGRGMIPLLHLKVCWGEHPIVIRIQKSHLLGE